AALLRPGRGASAERLPGAADGFGGAAHLAARLRRPGELLGELLARAARELRARGLDQLRRARGVAGGALLVDDDVPAGAVLAGDHPRPALRDREEGDQGRRHLLALAADVEPAD